MQQEQDHWARRTAPECAAADAVSILQACAQDLDAIERALPPSRRSAATRRALASMRSLICSGDGMRADLNCGSQQATFLATATKAIEALEECARGLDAIGRTTPPGRRGSVLQAAMDSLARRLGVAGELRVDLAKADRREPGGGADAGGEPESRPCPGR
jgi:hypothetical protein